MNVTSSALKKSLCLLLALAWMLALPLSALAADAYKTTARVNFRTDASTDAGIIKTLEAGVTVQVEEYDPDGWSRAAVGGVTGYLKSEYITKDNPPTQAKAVSDAGPSSSYRTTTRVNFRKSPSLNGEVIRLLSAGATVEMQDYKPDGWSKVTAGGDTGYVKSEYLVEASAFKGVAASEVELTPWSEAKSIMKPYTPAMITDVRSGAVYWIQSFSNGLHADVEPLTKGDTDILYNTFGRRWSWSVRPVWVTINGHTMAASINGQPHGGGTISGNGMNGQVCLHFKGSTTHNGNKSFAKLHQDGVMEAWNAAQR